MSSASFTTEFREEIEIERGRWLRKRFIWYSGVVLALHAFHFIGTGVSLLIDVGPTPKLFTASMLLSSIPATIAAILHVLALVYVLRHPVTRDLLLRMVFWLIVIVGALNLIISPVMTYWQRSHIDEMVHANGPINLSTRPGVQISIDPSDDEEEDAAAQDEVAQTPTQADAAPAAESATDADAKPELDQDAITRRTNKAHQIIELTAVFGGLGTIFGPHFFACLFLPWTPRESIKPLVPLLVLHVLVTIVAFGWSAPFWAIAVSILASPLVGFPGLAICWWRQHRFKDRYTTKLVKSRYSELKQELTSARQIHESLFPKPITDGRIRLDYRYEPMRQIGGDYLYARSSPDSLTIVIIDVTGHGITAALTVNRLHGEIDRQFGVNPDVGPGELLDALNAYLHHALASHSVYATALCIRVDTRNDTIAWASAGHPPAFIRAVDGTLDRLESTTLVLGACRGVDFQPAERQTRFTPGDVLIAYTDGAIEARNQMGKMLAVAGFERLVACIQPHTCTNPGDWCAGVLQMVDTHRFGPIQDDTLIVEISRPL